ncbi:MAG TPA: pyridoxamine 5'-phosphate oxidase family protein [Acidimicrobiia bacterium]|nr:pyridoxamine 5'-phosphate oxidase family protein [Acidimicrobiia bacterium]
MQKAAPQLAAAVQRSIATHIHKTLAKLRSDGSPRVSGQEMSFRDGDVWLGMMPDSRRARDLQRDPRLAVHSATADPTMAGGDAKLSGRAIEVNDRDTFDRFVGHEPDEKGVVPPEPFHLFRVDIDEIVLTTLGGDPPDHLVVETWHERRGLSRVERR